MSDQTNNRIHIRNHSEHILFGVYLLKKHIDLLWFLQFLSSQFIIFQIHFLEYKIGQRSAWSRWWYDNNDCGDDVIKWKHFPRYWPFVRRIHRSPVNSPHKGQWDGALILSLICVWINNWVNNSKTGDLRRYRVHYEVSVMCGDPLAPCQTERHLKNVCWKENIFALIRVLRNQLSDEQAQSHSLNQRWPLTYIHITRALFQYPITYCRISQSLGASRLVFRIIRSLWYLIGTLAAVLPKCLSNFKAVLTLEHPISRLRDFVRSHDKTSYRTLKWGISDLIQWCCQCLQITATHSKIRQPCMKCKGTQLLTEGQWFVSRIAHQILGPVVFGGVACPFPILSVCLCLAISQCNIGIYGTCHHSDVLISITYTSGVLFAK